MSRYTVYWERVLNGVLHNRVGPADTNVESWKAAQEKALAAKATWWAARDNATGIIESNWGVAPTQYTKEIAPWAIPAGMSVKGRRPDWMIPRNLVLIGGGALLLFFLLRR